MSPEKAVTARELAIKELPRIIQGEIRASADGRFKGGLFTRDASYFGLQTLDKPQNGEISIIMDGLKTSLREIASHQGTKFDPATAEEPFKMPHEKHGRDADQNHVSKSSLANWVEDHFELINYLSDDATPLWICLFGKYLSVTNDSQFRDELFPNFEKALRWLNKFNTGLIFSSGNHGWKDSGDAFVKEDGTYPKYPIALLDVNCFAYLANLSAAEIYESITDQAKAGFLRKKAIVQQRLINKLFWVEDMKLFAPAIDASWKPIKITTSDSAIALWSGVVDWDKQAVVAQRLLDGDLFIESRGLRTRSTLSSQYNPKKYQNGNVWNQLAPIAALACEKTSLFDEAEKFDACISTIAKEGFKELDGVDLNGNTFPYTEEDREVACKGQTWVIGGVLGRTLL